MQVHTRGRLAVAAMVDLALRMNGGPVSLSGISQRQQISLSNLEQLFSRLRRQDLVESTRGPGGGYRLSRSADDISVADIVAAVDDPDHEFVASMALPEGEAANRLVTRALWADLRATVFEHLRSISLRSLVDAQLAAGGSPEAPAPKRGILPRIVVPPLRPRGPNSVFALSGASLVDRSTFGTSLPRGRSRPDEKPASTAGRE